jgi:hypothetical protein
LGVSTVSRPVPLVISPTLLSWKKMLSCFVYAVIHCKAYTIVAPSAHTDVRTVKESPNGAFLQGLRGGRGLLHSQPALGNPRRPRIWSRL